MIGRMFRTPNPQRFEYRPRFYDPVKEELEERVNQSIMAKQGEKEAVKERISRGLRHRSGSKGISTEGALRSNILVLFIVVILVIMAFGLLNSPSILRLLGG